MYVVFIYLVTDRHMLLDIVLLQNCAIGTTGLTRNTWLGLKHSETLSVIN